MGMWQRFTMIFKSKANKALDRAEDPRETLDYSYEKQLDLLQKVRRGVADVATSRKRLELQIGQLDQQSAKLESQAKAALAGGREDLAREALTRRSGLTVQLNDLHAQLATLQDQEEKLTQASQRLQAKGSGARGDEREAPTPSKRNSPTRWSRWASPLTRCVDVSRRPLTCSGWPPCATVRSTPSLVGSSSGSRSARP